MGPLAFPQDKFRQVGSWDSPFLFLPILEAKYKCPLGVFWWLNGAGEVVCARGALMNWVLILLPFFFPLNLKTGTRLALELDAIV